MVIISKKVFVFRNKVVKNCCKIKFNIGNLSI